MFTLDIYKKNFAAVILERGKQQTMLRYYAYIGFSLANHFESPQSIKKTQTATKNSRQSSASLHIYRQTLQSLCFTTGSWLQLEAKNQLVVTA
jgi:hypothetical protein